MNIAIDLDKTLIDYDEKGNLYILDNVKEYLPKIYELGFKFHIITGRSHNSIDEVNGIATKISKELNIKFESITTTNSNYKGLYAKQKQCKYLIDDNVYFFKDCSENEVIPILYNNEEYSGNFSDVICGNWEYIFNLLSGINYSGL